MTGRREASVEQSELVTFEFIRDVLISKRRREARHEGHAPKAEDSDHVVGRQIT